MSLINVTRKERNGVVSVSDDLIQTDKIAYAIREISGEAYISVIESPLTGRGSENIVIGNYLVAEDVATICATTASLFTATVVTRDGKTPSTGYTALGFVAEKIMGPIMTEGSGAKFLYHEDNASNPVEYIVSETPAAIIAQTGTGEVPTPADGVLRYKALITQTGTLDPAATILENDLGGAIVWTRDNVGIYRGTLVGAFPSGKTLTIFSLPSSLVTSYQIYRATDDYVQLITIDSAGALADLVTSEPATIWIEVYP